jgi:DNA-binding HxlR family transcriptional regulator
MSSRTYGQYCGLAHALELVGERWAFLVVRDLLLGPKRFTDLRRTLPRIPTNILSARLKELEEMGVVRRRVLPRPATGVVYELTDYGHELEDVVLRLGLWGAKTLGEPRPDDVLAVDSLLLGLRATFQPKSARGVRASYELRVGDVVVHARVRDGKLDVGAGPLPEADLVVETGPALRALMTGELGAAEAIKRGVVRLEGKKKLFEQFVEVFRIPPVGVAVPA